MEIVPEGDRRHRAAPRERPAVPDYEILALAGRGAFGSVWVARDFTGVLHALKVVDVDRLPGRDPGDREEEAICLVRRRVPEHPHLVRITHVSRQETRLVYAMELADAAPGSPPPDQPGYLPDTLGRRLAANARLPVAEAIQLTLELLSALEALHAAKLVHRDVKPHNVVFVGGVPKLADVGLTAVARTALSAAGTPGYLPLDGSTGPDADLYALGKLLYQCVTGLEPADFPAMPARLLHGPEAKLIRRLNPVLLRTCAATKGGRFRSGGELRHALGLATHPSPRRWRNPLLLAVATAILFLGGWLVPAGRSPPPWGEVPPVGPIYFRPGDDAALARTELARRLRQPAILVNSLGMKLALIPAGEFLMGSPEGEEGRFPEENLHRVQISRPFYLGLYEVTQQEYQGVTGDNPSRYLGRRHPVEQVNWEDAVSFCRRLSHKEGARYRLPTEAEWEYACRAGTTTRSYVGRSVRLDQANVRGGQTLPVGQYEANPFGLFDTYGNVYEWCADWHAADYYRGSPVADPPGPARGERRVVRGAGWFDGPGTRERTDRRVRSAYRGAREVPTFRSNRIGFRVLRDVEPSVPPAG